jgi:hypothetical protein
MFGFSHLRGVVAATFCILFASATAVAADALRVDVKATDDGVDVTVDGAPFASYLLRSGHQPVIWPILGPDGQTMTRQYPLGEKLASEKDDHPHHRSLWFNHGAVNGLDFWMEPGAGEKNGGNQIVHREFLKTEAKEGVAEIVAANDWMSDGKKVCEDERTVKFSADENGRWIDFTVVVTASEGELVFGDTKEGAFGIRVPGEMDVDAKQEGGIRNSRGQQDEAAWGRSAEWVDYHGTIDGKPAGIVVFDMPDSFRHPTRWHVRTYGLFAANPFGESDFPPDDSKQGEVTLAPGEQLRLHYRVLFYSGERTPEEIAEIYGEQAK